MDKQRDRDIRAHLETRLLSELEEIKQAPSNEWSSQAVQMATQLIEERELNGTGLAIDQQILQQRELEANGPPVDPEMRLIGTETDYPGTVAGFSDPKNFRIDAARFPIGFFVITNAILLLIGAAVLMLVSAILWVKIAVVCIASMSCFIWTTVIIYQYQRSREIGARFVFDRITQSITLPMHDIVLEPKDVVRFQHLRVRVIGEETDKSISELNLIGMHEGTRQRWNITRSDLSFRPFGKLPKQIREQTNIRIDQMFGPVTNWEDIKSG